MNFDPYYVDPLFLRKENEKKEIRSAANRTAIAFLLMSAVMVFWSYPVLSLATSLGFEKALFVWIKDDALINVFQIIISSVAFIFPYLLLSKLFNLKLNDAIAVNPIKDKKQFLSLMLIGISVCGFVNTLTSFAGYLLENMGFHYEANIHNENPNNLMGFLLSVIATAITPAVVEEFAMRGVLLSGLRRFGDGFAILISSVIFGLMHGNFEQIPFAFPLGLYLGFITVKMGSIVPAVILHFLNNFLSIVMSYLSDTLGYAARQISFPLYFLLLLVPGFIGISMLKNEKDTFFKLDKVESALSEKSKIVTFLTAPSMILVWAAVILESLFVYA